YIRDLVYQYDISEIIVGHPLNMDGSAGKIAKQVEKFCKSLHNQLRIQPQLVDERLTSFEAEELIKEHLPDYKKRKKILDSISALVILKSYMKIY
ncbi:MAG: Holliday junction resolvase RuvX, partial [bacterium]|nr:Holliday junction resolvase RuvX [bacterium]